MILLPHIKYILNCIWFILQLSFKLYRHGNHGNFKQERKKSATLKINVFIIINIIVPTWHWLATEKYSFKYTHIYFKYYKF